jgi:DNA-binding transcriptional regulator YiaG
LTIFELLDALEAGLVKLKTAPQRMNGVPWTRDELEADADVHWTTAVARAQSLTPEELRVRLDSADLSHEDFAALFEVQPATLQNWLGGKSKVPGWVGPSLRVVEQLSTSARRRLMRRNGEPASAPTLFTTFDPAPKALSTGESPGRNRKKHPFARIEEL